MNKFFHLAIRLILIFTIIFIATQVFNGFCKITQKCSPFYFSYYLHGKEGSEPFNVVFGINNYRTDLEFEPIESSITTVANRNNKVTYRIKNNSDHFINFHIKLHVDPEKAKNDLVVYQCLCDSNYKLKKGEERILEMKFRIKGSGKRSDGLTMSRFFQKNNSVNFSGSQNRGMVKTMEPPQQSQLIKNNARKSGGTGSDDVPVLRIVDDVPVLRIVYEVL